MQVRIGTGQNWCRSESAQVRISAGQNQRRSELAQIRIGTGQNRHRTKSAQVKMAQKKNELTLLFSTLIKKKSFAKLTVLRLMVTHYIGNMIVFLPCHYAYLSITITSKLSALNHNKILYYCNCHATISSSIHMFASSFRKLWK